MSEAGAPLVPSYGLNLTRVPIRERADAWRQAFGGQWDMPELPPLLQVEGRAFDLGKAVLVDTVHPRLNFVRDRAKARRDGADNVYVLMQVAGGYALATEAVEGEVAPGQVTLFDIAKPVTRRAYPGRTICLSVSRELVEESLPGLDVHALSLDGGPGAFLAEHLRSLRTHLPAMSSTAAPHLLQATMHMLAACVQPTPERMEQAAPALSHAVFTRAKRYIRANCRDPELTPEKVAAAIGASRTSLYRAFEPKGGVADYIRRARLEAARAALSDPADTRRIGEIAFACGFTSEAHFSRAVRAAFGATPGELRRGFAADQAQHRKGMWSERGWGEETATPTAAPELARVS